MTLFSLISALLLEQWRPRVISNRIILLFLSYADALERYFNTGVRRHGIAAWIAAVVPVLIFTGWIYYLLHGLSPLLAWAWNVHYAVSHHGFSAVQPLIHRNKDALKNGDLLLARKLLRDWRGVRSG